MNYNPNIFFNQNQQPNYDIEKIKKMLLATNGDNLNKSDVNINVLVSALGDFINDYHTKNGKLPVFPQIQNVSLNGGAFYGGAYNGPKGGSTKEDFYKAMAYFIYYNGDDQPSDEQSLDIIKSIETGNLKNYLLPDRSFSVNYNEFNEILVDGKQFDVQKFKNEMNNNNSYYHDNNVIFSNTNYETISKNSQWKFFRRYFRLKFWTAAELKPFLTNISSTSTESSSPSISIKSPSTSIQSPSPSTELPSISIQSPSPSTSPSISAQSLSTSTPFSFYGNFIPSSSSSQSPSTSSSSSTPSTPPPVYDENIHPAKFQMIVQKYIRNLPLEYQLYYLNKIQDTCPFLIIDPVSGKITHLKSNAENKTQYGFADLFRFLGMNFGVPVRIEKFKRNPYLYQPTVSPGKFNIETQTYQNNPLFQPVKYSHIVPDAYGNAVLQKMYENNPHKIFSKLEDLYGKLNTGLSETGKYVIFGGSNKSKKTKSEEIAENLYIEATLKDISELLQKLLTFQINPQFIYSEMDNALQPRPMRQYFKNNIDAMLYNLLISHKIYNDKHKPNTDFEISSKILDKFKEFQGKTQSTFPKQKSKQKLKPKSKKKLQSNLIPKKSQRTSK